MNKAGKFLLSTLLALGFMMPSASSAAPDVTLSLNLPIPPIHTRWQGPLKAWVEEIEKRSNGRIKIEPYFAEALSPRSEAFDSVKSGIADLTECAYEANSGQFPFHEGILSIPSPQFALDNGSALINGMYAKYPEVLKELEGVKLLVSHASGSLTIGTTKKPIKSLEDLKGMKIQANSAMIAERLKKLGVSVVSMPLGDLYTALEQGVIEGTTLSPELLVSRRWGDCIKNLTQLSVQNTLFYIIMNEDVFNSLPEDLQQVFLDVSGEFSDKAFGDYWATADVSVIDRWVNEMGGQSVNIFSAEDYEKAAAAMQGPVDEWFQTLSKKGFPGEQMKKDFYEIEKQVAVPHTESAFSKAYFAKTAK